MLSVKASERIVDERELIVCAAELPHNLMRGQVEFDYRAEISIGNDQTAIQIEIEGIRVVQIRERWRLNVFSRVPLVFARDQSVHSSQGAYGEYCMNS
jgi:hypothetical protein